jgi:aminomethyltransferase
MDCGLGWTVDLTAKRDFIGRPALAGQPQRHQLGVVLLDRGVMRSHQVVRTPAGDGMVTSGGFAPTLNRSIGLARLPSAVSADAVVEVSVRGKWLAAKTVKPPFVRHGRILVGM